MTTSKLDLFLNGNVERPKMEKEASQEPGQKVPILDHQRKLMTEKLEALEKEGKAGTPYYNKMKRRLRNTMITDVVGPSERCYSYEDFVKAIS